MLLLACLIAFIGFLLLTLGLTRWYNPIPEHTNKLAAPVVIVAGLIYLITSEVIIFIVEHEPAWATLVPAVGLIAAFIIAALSPKLGEKLANPGHWGWHWDR